MTTAPMTSEALRSQVKGVLAPGSGVAGWS